MKLPLFKIGVSADDIAAVNKVLARGESWAQGPEIEEFEQRIAEYIGTEYAVVFNSGTSALHAIMLALSIGRGSETIVPAFTFAATANAPRFVGSRPVFTDIDRESFGLDANEVLNDICRHTRVIIAVHYAGCPCNIKALEDVAEAEGIHLVEDCAEAFGAEVDGKKVGSFGIASAHSFCQSKIISTGEGGAVTTDHPFIYRDLLSLRSHGCPCYIGYNWRMPTMNAALGLSQLNRVDEIISKRRAVAERWQNGLVNSSIVSVPEVPYSRKHVYQMFPMLAKGSRDELIDYLKKAGIDSKVYFPSLTSQRLPVTDDISSKVLCLHPHPALTEEEIKYVIEVLK
jgi:dTDP-4-amino-4,6-dideoxygalactose transaminase